MSISTRTTIEIGTETLSRFTNLVINQKVNAHHTFSIVQPMPREFVNDGIEKSQSYIGQKIRITIAPNNLKTESSFVFYGIITQAKMVRNTGSSGQIIINGFSNTILLEANKNTRSFTNKSISDIVFEVIGKNENDLKTTTSIKNDTSLPYTVQYNETDFGFLRRLAQKKGEWLYYNGEALRFGKPNSKEFELEYGLSLHNFEIEMNAKPINFEYLGYDPITADTQKANSTEINHDTKGYSKKAYESSKKLFSERNTVLYPNPLEESGARTHLIDRVTTQTQAEVASLVTATGETDETGIRIGDIIIIKQSSFSATGNPIDGLKDENFGGYLITEIEHTCDETGNYNNTFQAVPDNVITPPYGDVFLAPQAEAQPAVVTNNNDPKGLGRIQVTFAWQVQAGEKNPWLRMTNAHAGGGKGIFFLPEIGEEVLVGFEANNAEKPFVLGSMYNGKGVSGFGNEQNSIKAIQTRSGTKIIIDDSQKSILIEDPSGNSWLMDGNGSINVSAPKRITMNASDIEINAFNNLEMNVANNMIMNVMTKIFVFTPYLNQVVSGFMNLFSGKALINSEHEMKITSPDMHLAGHDKLFLHSDKQVTANSKGKLALDGEKGNNLSNKATSVNPPVLEKIALAIVEFRPMDTYNGEYGFDWLRINDNGLNLEPDYATIIESGYEKPNGVIGTTPAGKPIYSDANTKFEAGEAFIALEKEYKKIPIKRTAPTTPTKYYAPWLNLYPKTVSDTITTLPKPPFEAELKILTDVEGTDVPDQIRVVFNKDYFEINGKDGTDANPVLLSDKAIGAKRIASDTLKIKCIGEFGTEQEIKVYVYPKDLLAKSTALQLVERKIAGKIIVGANKNDAKIKNRKKQKFVFVNVRLNINGTTTLGSFTAGEKNNLQNALHQSLIHGEFEDYINSSGTNVFDLTADNNFKILTNASTGVKTYGKYIYEKSVRDPSGTAQTTDGYIFEDYTAHGMFTYLRTEFLAKPGNSSKYSNHFTVFCFNEKPYDYYLDPTSGGYSTTLGQAEDISHKNVILFDLRNDNTLNHEGLHGLGLEHTHDDGSFKRSRKYTFNKFKTTNIMSYANHTTNPSATKVTTWHWQWKILKSSVK